MAWIMLVIAGIFEVGWAVGLKYTHGFTRPWPTLATIACIVVSMGLLGLAARSLPIGTAYAVWTGIGAVGTFVLGILFLQEPAAGLRFLFVGFIVVGIVGLKLASPA